MGNKDDKDIVKKAITDMVANGGTNVPEGMAWGWRVLSHGEPFTDGRPESEKGNTKVLIVLTDGANTYYPPSWLGFDRFGREQVDLFQPRLCRKGDTGLFDLAHLPGHHRSTRRTTRTPTTPRR